jgi:hypothetical protein
VRFEEGTGQAMFGDLGGVVVMGQSHDQTVADCVGDVAVEVLVTFEIKL